LAAHAQLLCSSGKQELNKRGTNRRPLDVI
jgi:hypothetical protein